MSEITLGDHIKFPAYGEKSLSSQVVFITGKRGSGKSFTAGVMMEEFDKAQLQFVCFDVLSAHSGMDALPNVESIRPREDETIDMNLLVSKIANGNKSLVIDIGACTLPKQQLLIADYCEALIDAKIGHNHNKTLMTIVEECQDFVPQQGRPVSFNPIVRLCKLGRGLGYGCTLITQRPAACNKEALSQAAVYLTHNVINSRDLKALEEQLSFGTDRERVKRILQGVNAAQKGEVVAYAPEYFRETGYIRIGKIRGDRRVKHTGGNISASPINSVPADKAAGDSSTFTSLGYGDPVVSGNSEGQNNFADTAMPTGLVTLEPISSLTTAGAASSLLTSNMGFRPIDPYANSEMGGDSYLTDFDLDNSREEILTWDPPVTYEGLEDMDADDFLAEAEGQKQSSFKGPLWGFGVAVMIASGAYFVVKK